MEDGIISQMEFTRFLIHHCIQQGLCDDRTIITFEELDVGLQLDFILGVCSHEEQEMKAQCIRDLEIMWREGDQFGFDVNDNDMDSLSMDVGDMCEQAYDHVVEMGLAKTQGTNSMHYSYLLFSLHLLYNHELTLISVLSPNKVVFGTTQCFSSCNAIAKSISISQQECKSFYLHCH